MKHFDPLPSQEDLDRAERWAREDAERPRIDWLACTFWFVVTPLLALAGWAAIVAGTWAIGVWIGRLLMGWAV